MKPERNPPRLIEDPEFGGVLQDVATRRWSPDRLAANADAIQAKVAGLTAAGAASAGVLSAAKTTTAVKFGIPIAVAVLVGTTAIVVTSDDPPPPPSLQQAIGEEQTTAADPAPVVLEKEKPRAVAPKRRLRQKRSPSPESVLPDQIRRFNAAKAAAKQGDFDRALDLLANLLETHPDTALRAEVFLAQAEYLARAGRDEDAIRLIESILDDPRVTSKKAQLLQLVADVWLRRGVCGRAVPAYQRALGLGLDEDGVVSAQAGLKKCATR